MIFRGPIFFQIFKFLLVEIKWRPICRLMYISKTEAMKHNESLGNSVELKFLYKN